MTKGTHLIKRTPRVLVTRAKNQVSALAEELYRLGAEPVSVPLLEIAPPDSWEELDVALAQAASFDWIIFTSANAVHAVKARATEQHIILAFGRAKIAAIGAATAQALNSIGAEADLIPELAVAESLAEALTPFARQPDASPTRFLLLRAQEGREHLPERLRNAGAIVSVVPAYSSHVPTDAIKTLQRCFNGPAGPPDGITITSSSAARNFFALLGAAGLELTGETAIASIGPITSATLRELGYPPNVEAEKASVASLAKAMMHCLRTRIS